MKTAIVPTRAENYPEWYQQVIKKADLAESSAVYGCMIIKPWGYAIWEKIQKALDDRIKATGHENLYFPMFIPLSYIEKEAEHVQGFAKECAVVTHHRLVQTEDGKLVPSSPLEEPLVIRPTSETIIGKSFARWVQSHRDLPLLINQWANIVRWEMRPRLFLRTTEFLWQEGHTAHSTAEEAIEETLKMLEVYADFAEKVMAVPVIKGIKTKSETFPGALDTYCIEAMMQDGKALQSGTSHYFGQKFAKAFDIQFLNETGVRDYAWTTSWGVSTRLIGGLIMTHSDDDGLVLPPALAPVHVVIIPVAHKFKEPQKIDAYCDALAEALKQQTYNQLPITVKVDHSDDSPGNKNWNWVKKGVPIRIEVGPKEFESQSVYVGRRDQPYSAKSSMSCEAFIQACSSILSEIQEQLLQRAKQFVADHTVHVSSKEDFYAYFKGANPGFAYAYWCEDDVTEQMIKRDLNVTARCIALEDRHSEGKCIFSEKSGKKTLFAKAY